MIKKDKAHFIYVECNIVKSVEVLLLPQFTTCTRLQLLLKHESIILCLSALDGINSNEHKYMYKTNIGEEFRIVNME